MKISKLAVLTALIILVTSCGKKAEQNYTVKEVNGIKVYSNQNEPSDKDLKVELKEVLKINGFIEGQPEERNIAMPMAVDADKEGNIFVLDRKSASVKKFSKNGEFIKSFGREGTGPGESREVSAMNIIGDTVVVVDMGGQKQPKFDLNGSHIADTTICGNRTAVFFKPLKDGNSVGVIWYEGMENSEYYVSVSLSIIDDKFKEIKVLDTQKRKFVPEKFNIADLIGSYAVSEDKIYINSPSEDKFLVKAYDFNGNELYNISKNYRRLLMSAKEVKSFNDGMKKVFGLNLAAVEIAKRSINGMEYDKYGRLWVMTSAERNESNENTFYAELFKGGVYLNRIEVPQFKGSDYFDIGRQMYFIGEFIYLLDLENNEITVYNY